MRTVLLLPLFALLPALAHAQAGAAQRSVEEYARLPVCQLAPDGRRLAVEPCRTAPPRRPMPRRPVPLTVEPTPRVASPAVPSPAVPGPTLPLVLERRSGTPATALATPAVPAPAPGAFAAPPPGPGPVMPATCGPAGCQGANGSYYGGAPGSVSVNAAGRQCITSAAGLVQCF